MESGLPGGDGKALERGDEGCDRTPGAEVSTGACSARIVDVLVLIAQSIYVRRCCKY